MKTRKLRFPALFILTVFFLGSMGFAGRLQAQTVKPVTIESSKDFKGTLDAIKKAVSGGGMMVLAEINQGKILSMTGLKINAYSLFIGNPNVGNMAFSADPSVGVVIPVRVNVYEENGKVKVNYYKPSDLLAFSQNQKVKMIANKLNGKLEMMLKMIAK